ncbi:MAG TPA: addiction module protein [Candidatus Paceibacterota bacterium]|nr:addiction module protein [Candidatus Paceibacterota bacterium]
MKMLSEIAKEALELSSGQRRILARILLDLSDEDQDFSPDVEASWEDEICRRMEAVHSGHAKNRNYDEVMNELDARFGA